MGTNEISTWMGDRLRAGIPYRYVTSQLGQRSLAINLPIVGGTTTVASIVNLVRPMTVASLSH